MSASGLGSEIKFVVPAPTGTAVAQWARERLSPDPHGGGPAGDSYSISSIYFDTDAWHVFHRRGSYGRSKYRIRRYGHESTAYVERKLRTGGRLAKTRTGIDLDALADPVGGASVEHAGAIRWFERRLAVRQLVPVCQVVYQRTARVLDTPHGLARLTIDRNLNALSNEGRTFLAGPGVPFLVDEMVIEMKFRSPMPPVFEALVETFALAPAVASKYRTAAQALGLVSAYV